MQFEDGNLANIKKLFLDTWTNDDIIKNIKTVSDSKPIGIRASDRAILHRNVINGVQVEVIKLGDKVVSGYPTGGLNTKLLPGFK